MRIRALCLALSATVIALPALAGEHHDSSAHYEKGKRAFDGGDFAKAIEELKASVAALPNAKAYLLLGNAYTKLGQLADAKQAFESFLKAEPKSSKKHTVENLIRELDVLGKTKLQVTSTPPGATVFLDLKAEGPRGKTPLELPAVPGPHRVMLDLDGYQALSVNATAVEGQSVPVVATLKAKGCELTVELSQPGASFAVDGGSPTPAPATVPVGLGKHKVTVVGQGKEQTVECDKEKPLKLSLVIEQSRKALLSLRAPDGAKILVDGKEASAADARKLEVDPGEHVIDVTRQGNAPWHLSVVARPGEKVDLEPRLDVGGGGATGIEVVAEPANAVITVDGAPAASGTVVPLSPGDHAVDVRAPGHHAFARTVPIVAGEKAHLEARLEPKSRFPLGLGLGLVVLAIGAETVALVGHGRAGREIAGSTNYNTWHDTELGGHISAGVLAAGAIASLGIFFWQWRSGEGAAPTRIGAAATPGGGALTITGSF
jgi:hypothetical protein